MEEIKSRFSIQCRIMRTASAFATCANVFHSSNSSKAWIDRSENEIFSERDYHNEKVLNEKF